MKKKFLITATLLLLSISAFPVSALDTPVRNPSNLSPSSFAFIFTEGNQGFGNVSSKLVSSQANFTPPSQPDTHLCVSFSDPKCNISGFDSFDALSVLNPCLSSTPQPCVKSLSIIDGQGATHKASLVRTVDAPVFPSEASVNLPEGGSTSLWQVSDLDGVKDYAVTYYIQSQYSKNNGVGKFVPKTFSAFVYPYKEKIMSNATKKSFQENIYPNGHLGVVGLGGAAGANCAWTEDGKCGVEQEFDAGFSAELTINLPDSLTGWLNGRLIAPEISVTPIGNSINELKIKAKPADVPIAYAETPYSQTTDEMKQLYKNNSHAIAGFSVRDSVQVAGTFGFQYLSAFQSLLGDKAQIKSTSWNLSSLDGVGNGPQNICLQSNSKILGLVTTNAMLYENTLPKFENGFLNYKVGGLHYNPDGTTFQGAYDLIIRSETARCLYGFSNAPLSAEISVISVGGEKQVATTQLSESNDWIHLSAYNFGFSSPTIQIKLEQKLQKPTPASSPEPAQPTQPLPSAPALSSLTNSKQLTIACTKGKITKKVTAVSPKCPAGYKKK